LILTPGNAVPMLFAAGPNLLFQDNKLDPGPLRHVVRCLATGILHHHDFDRDAESLVVADTMRAQAPVLRSKYAALWSRLDETCGTGGRVLFMRGWWAVLQHPDSAPRQDPVGGYDFEGVVSSIGARYPRLDFEMMFVNYGPRTIADPRARFVDVDYSREACDWRGSDLGWDEVFDGIELTPAGMTTRQQLAALAQA